MGIIQIGDCFSAKTGNVYIVFSREDDDRYGVFFPFFGIRGQAGTLPGSQIATDKRLPEIIEFSDDGTMNGIEIITKLGHYNTTQNG